MKITEAIRQIYKVGIDHDHKNERLPAELVQQLIWCGFDGQETNSENRPGDLIGVLMLMLGVANWGVKWKDLIPIDPANDNWEGRPARSGKHFIDGTKLAPYGGLGIAHLDSGSLIDVYNQWGWPDKRKNLLKSNGKPINFDALRNNQRTWKKFLAWSTKLSKRYEYHDWMIRMWLDEYWYPAWSAAVKENNRQDWLWIIHSAAINSRYANSLKYAAKKWRGYSGLENEDAYYEDKLHRRGQANANRTLRQISYARRVVEVVEILRINALTG